MGFSAGQGLDRLGRRAMTFAGRLAIASLATSPPLGHLGTSMARTHTFHSMRRRSWTGRWHCSIRGRGASGARGARVCAGVTRAAARSGASSRSAGSATMLVSLPRKQASIIAAKPGNAAASRPASRQATRPGGTSATASLIRARAACAPFDPTSGQTAVQAQPSASGRAAKCRQIRFTIGTPDTAQISA